jgi:hypothetical protein
MPSAGSAERHGSRSIASRTRLLALAVFTALTLVMLRAN